MTLRRLIYVSEVSNDVRLEDAEAIAERSAERNAEDALTGFLLYTPTYFVQVLEGEPAPLETTFARITEDRRHRAVRTLSDTPIDQRAFPQWSMGFACLKQVFDPDLDPTPERWDAAELLERLKQAARQRG